MDLSSEGPEFTPQRHPETDSLPRRGDEAPGSREPDIFDVVVVGLFAGHALFRPLVLVFVPTGVLTFASYLVGDSDNPIGTVLSVLALSSVAIALSAASFILRRGPNQGRVSALDALGRELAAPAVPAATAVLMAVGSRLQFGPGLLGAAPGLPFQLVAILLAVLAPLEGLGVAGGVRRGLQLLRQAPLRFCATLGCALLVTGTGATLVLTAVEIFGGPVLLGSALLITLAGPFGAGVLFASVEHLRHRERLAQLNPPARP